jgi:hypothetical protein
MHYCKTRTGVSDTECTSSLVSFSVSTLELLTTLASDSSALGLYVPDPIDVHAEKAVALFGITGAPYVRSGHGSLRPLLDYVYFDM